MPVRSIVTSGEGSERMYGQEAFGIARAAAAEDACPRISFVSEYLTRLRYGAAVETPDRIIIWTAGVLTIWPVRLLSRLVR